MPKLLMTLCLAAMAVMPSYAAEQIENFTAKMFTSKGTVECLKTGAADWVAVQAPYMLDVGDQVRTGGKSKAEIYMKYGSKIRLEADTTFKVGKVSHEENAVEVLKGRMQAWIRKFAGRAFSVRTPAAVCAVRGTVFEVEVAETGESTWDLFNGSIQIADSQNRTVDLQPGQRVAVAAAPEAPPPAPVPLPPGVKPPAEPPKIAEEKTEIKAEKAIIDQKAKEEAAARKAAEKKAKEEAAAAKIAAAEKAAAEKAAAEKAAAEKAAAEKAAAEAAAAEAAAAVPAAVKPAAEEPAAEEPVLIPVIQEPITTVIPTEVVKEAEEVSGSNP